MNSPLLTTNLPGLKRFVGGKVRDVYDLGEELLLIATDRISAFDVVMPNGIPDKGRTLTQISHFWFTKLRAIVPAHEISVDAGEIAARLAKEGVADTPELRAMLDGRAVLGKKAQAFPVECVARGYLAGSLWKEYRQAGGEKDGAQLHGFDFPPGLVESARLPEPIFTPATKADAGHDRNIGLSEAAQIVGAKQAEELRDVTLALYTAAADYALKRGIILADTKFEFGLRDGKLLWIDEALTPDSSRFWDAALYEPGKAQASFDKQFVRDWLEGSGWNKEPPAPVLPADIVEKTAAKYRDAYNRITNTLLNSDNEGTIWIKA